MQSGPHVRVSCRDQPSGAADDAWDDTLGSAAPRTAPGIQGGGGLAPGQPCTALSQKCVVPSRTGYPGVEEADSSKPGGEESCQQHLVARSIGPSCPPRGQHVSLNGPREGETKQQGTSAVSRGRKAALPAGAQAGKGAAGDGGTHGGRPPAEFPILELPPLLVQEVFQHLDAHDLSVVSCVCKVFHQLAAESQKWENLFTERWGEPVTLAPPAGHVPPTTARAGGGGGGGDGEEQEVPARRWRSLYLDREIRSRAMLGRYQLDMLHAHTASIRCARMLPAAGLAVTAGYDSSVRVWGLEDGLLRASSAPLGETLRAVTLDAELLAVAGTDAAVYVWSAAVACPHRFDVAGLWTSGRRSSRALYGHTGPVSCLGVTPAHVFSGSWDMSVRAWGRANFRTARTFAHDDWVWALVCRGPRLVSTAGPSQYTWDVETGRLLRVRRGVHAGLQAYAVEGSRSGNAVFTGGADGLVHMFDERAPPRGAKGEPAASAQEAVATWQPHGAAVSSLSMEDPWLVSASDDGTVAMMNVGHLISQRRSGGGKRHLQHVAGGGSKGTAPGRSVQAGGGAGGSLEVVQRKLGGIQKRLYSVDIGADRVLCAGDDLVARVFDFTKAADAERRVQVARSVRSAQRNHRKQAVETAAKKQQPTKGRDVHSRPEGIAFG